MEPHVLLFNLFLYEYFVIEITRNLALLLQKLIEQFWCITVFVFLPLDDIHIDEQHKSE